ncbi:hypothetical protein CSB93_5893 [Pseudomonas paraeruginosa]|uniref:Uncharacterized protein n=1 Tax=Pseudomonas paraeruginosa TaxID=2994495 RepID=A0A2R3J4I5_9PSED|nr:hypothetical protein CSB93_5893 [Pseudomonas paraeruginosa]AWE93044.1 hypothetical protein CSC28_4691 [Pseudomonas paraeruginosa]
MTAARPRAAVAFATQPASGTVRRRNPGYVCLFNPLCAP